MSKKILIILSTVLLALGIITPVNKLNALSEEEAYKNLTKAEEAYEKAQQAYDKGSLGFFEYVGSNEAVNILKDGRLDDYTNIGQDGDATNLDNMKYAIEIMEVCNNFRKNDDILTDNRYGLKVTDKQMAIAQKQNNWSAEHFLKHSEEYTYDENLAYGYYADEELSYDDNIGPFQTWYNEEKKNYQNEDGTTFHYENIMGDFIYTGAALSDKDGCYDVVSQVFDDKESNEKAYSVSEYRNRFMEYYNKIYDDLNTAKENLEKAQKAYRKVSNVEKVWNRLGGDTRYETMSLITEEGYADNSCESIILTTGKNYPDALAGSALAGLLSAPLITTKSDVLSEDARKEILRTAKNENTVVYILGGTNAVSEEVEKAVQELGLSTERIAGDTRQKTALKIYEKGKGRWGNTCVIAYGNNFPDSLSVGPYSYVNKAPVFLTNKSGSISDEVKNIILENFDNIVIVGGESVVSKDVFWNLYFSGKEVIRLAGDTRYETSEEIALWSAGKKTDYSVQPETVLSLDGLGVAYAANFPDALTAVNVLGPSKSVLILASYDKDSTKENTNKVFENIFNNYYNEINEGYIFGGTSAVSKDIENTLKSY